MEQPEWGVKLSTYIPIPQRVIMALMCFLSMINAYTLRICLSVAITRLVPQIVHNVTLNPDACPDLDNSDTTNETVAEAGTYNWSQETQGTILGAFYIGYFFGNVPAGMLSVAYGAKWVLCIGLLAASLLTVLTPVFIMIGGEESATLLIAIRILMGLFGGCSFPAMSALLAQWVPPQERGLLGCLIMGGGQIGTVVSNTVSGFILHYSSWPWVFYTFGLSTTLWCAFFVVMCFNDPDSHPYIRPSEKEYLRETMGRTSRRTDLPPTPWKDIFTSAPVISLIIAQVAHDWSFYIVVSDLPKYMNDVIRFSIKKNGVYSSLPFLAMWLCTMLCGWVADVMFNRCHFTMTFVRKFMTFIATVPSGIFLVLPSYAGCNRGFVVACFTIAMACKGGYYAGIKLSANDMSPNYAPTVLAVVNSIGALTGFLAPYTAGALAPHSYLNEWRLVFWLAFLILTIFSIPYLIWATADVQPWNDPKPKDDK